MRYGADDDEMRAAQARHAADERREHEEDRRATDRMWRENEAARRQERWDRTATQMRVEWHFGPLREADGRVSGWTAFMNGRKVGVVIPVRGDLVVITSEEGEADVHYVRGSQIVSPDANQIMAAFQNQLPEGARR